MTGENEAGLPRCTFGSVPKDATFFYRGEWWKKERPPQDETFTTKFIAVQRSTNSVRMMSLPDTEEVQYSPAN